MKSFISTVPFILASAKLSSASAPNPGSQWTNTLFLDDFNGNAGSLPSASNWMLRTGTSYPGGPANWGTGEVETYTNSPANVQLSGNGYLYITPLKSSSGQWTSARIETVSSAFQAPAGGKMRIEASVRMPNVNSNNGQGYWPAFWALGGGLRNNYNSWPSIGEYDIMEHVNALGTTNQALHCGTDPNGPCNEPDGLGKESSCPNSGCLGNFHTYTLIVDRSSSPESLNWYIDQQLQYTVTESQLGSSTWSETVYHGFYLIANVAMGGAFPNGVAGYSTPTANTVSGVSMAIDYVAVWTT